MTHIKPLKDLVEPGWAQALADVEPQIHLMGDFLRSEIAAGRKYLPASRNILRAFTIPFDDIKVLIVGQDPSTHRPALGGTELLRGTGRQAHSAQSGEHLHRADRRSGRAHAGQRRPDTLDQTGVMLLNRCLTVEPGKPGSHQGEAGKWSPTRPSAH